MISLKHTKYTSLYVFLSLELKVYIVRWNCAVRARKLLILQEILWLIITTCLVISSIEFIQYLIFKTCWVDFLFLEQYNITTLEPVENFTGLSGVYFSFKTFGRPHKITKDIQKEGKG